MMRDVQPKESEMFTISTALCTYDPDTKTFSTEASDINMSRFPKMVFLKSVNTGKEISCLQFEADTIHGELTGVSYMPLPDENGNSAPFDKLIIFND